MGVGRCSAGTDKELKMSAAQRSQAFARPLTILGGLHACAADHIQQPVHAKANVLSCFSGNWSMPQEPMTQILANSWKVIKLRVARQQIRYVEAPTGTTSKSSGGPLLRLLSAFGLQPL